jgi:hypothetical protein
MAWATRRSRLRFSSADTADKRTGARGLDAEERLRWRDFTGEAVRNVAVLSLSSCDDRSNESGRAGARVTALSADGTRLDKMVRNGLWLAAREAAADSWDGGSQWTMVAKICKIAPDALTCTCPAGD